MPEKAAISYGDISSIEHLDGVKFTSGTVTEQQRIDAYRARIEDMYAVGVRVMFLGGFGDNGTSQVTRAASFNTAARQFNAAHTSDKICISWMFESDAAGNGTTSGVLPMFDAVDTGGSNSPLCTIGELPVVGVISRTGLCVNPLQHLSARGPNFAVFGTIYNGQGNYLSTTCKNTLTTSGGSIFKSWVWPVEKAIESTAAQILTRKTDITATGAEFVPGVGTAFSLSCGDGGAAKNNANYVLTDLNYFAHTLDGWRNSLAQSPNYVMLAQAGPGHIGQDAYFSTARICDQNDKAPHNVDSSGINHGFSCPNVPNELTAAMPSGHKNSFSLPLWTRPGFWRINKLFTQWLTSGTEPAADSGFVAFTYRQHKWGLTGTWQVCPDATYIIDPDSVGGAYQGDYIALTSWLPNDTRVKVKLAGDTIFDGTLPAKQAKINGATNQTRVAIGNRVGRPTIEVLDADGAVAYSKTGLLEITNTPKHFGGKTGRNPGLYADYIDILQSGAIVTGIDIEAKGTIENNIIYDVSGTGAQVSGSADDSKVVNNTLVRNTVGVGAGRAETTLNGLVISNNIITNASIGVSKVGDIGSDAVYSNQLFYQNTSNMSSAIATVATNTVTADPMFVSTSDFHIQSGSPARDAGSTTYSPASDRDGRTRSAVPDIGALEFYDSGTRSACVDPNIGTIAELASILPEACPPVPTLTDQTNIVVGADGGTYNLGETEDAYITCSEPVTKTINVYGGRNVHIKGCEIVLTWSGVTALQNTRALNLAGMDQVYVEGTLIDANDRCDGMFVSHHSDLVGYGNIDTKVTVVNTWIGNTNAGRLNGACTGHCLYLAPEQQGGKITTDIKNLTCMTKSEGIYVEDREGDRNNESTITNVNTKFGVDGSPMFGIAQGANILYYLFGDSGNKAATYQLYNVFSDWSLNNRNVSPGPVTGTSQYTNFSYEDYILFKDSGISGEISRGTPDVGDFAPRDKVGINYDRSEFCE